MLCHASAHVINSEGGGLAANAGAQAVALPGERGIFTAVTLTNALRRFDALVVEPVETNLVYLRSRRTTSAQLAAALREHGILVSHLPPDRLRACTHLGITDDGLERSIEAFAKIL